MTIRTPATLAGRKRIFESVFPPSRLKDLAPTPAATPVLGQTEFNQSFGGPIFSPTSLSPPEASASYPEQVIWDRTWHTAISYLDLSGRDFVEQRQQQVLNAFTAHYNNAPKDVVESIRYLISKHQEKLAQGQKTEHGSILEWYTDHVRGHFLGYSTQSLLRVSSELSHYGSTDPLQQFRIKDAGEALLQISNSLDMLHAIYTYPIKACILPHLPPFEAKLAKSKFEGDLHALTAYALPQTRIGDLLTRLLSGCSRRILGIGGKEFGSSAQTNRFVEKQNELMALMETLSRVGLGGDKARRIFAAVLDNMLTEFVNQCHARIDDEWTVVPQFSYWIEVVFAKFAVEVLSALRNGERALSGDSSETSLADVQNWEEMAVTRLGALRVEQLFDIVMNWDSTKSGIDDLSSYTTNPSTRTYLISKFIAVLSSRLLHPGVSTLHILRVYISIIRAFMRLDQKGVLLDRVARPLRRYLRDREDTVKVIVAGLFSDADDGEGQPLPPDAEVLNEAAIELKEHGIKNAKDEEGDIDWNNPNWVPDPIDAAPEYKKSKNLDVIGSLMSLFESKDAIVKELQTTLSERLLKNQQNFNQETTVLELLKIRFGESVLQSCSAMLRDVKRESINIDQTVRQEQGLERSEKVGNEESEERSQPELHAKILSHLFWPTLQDQTFKIPVQILAQQHLYETGFSALKQSRKLTWLNALGQVELQLELEDRCFEGEVTPWEASVINAFEANPFTSTTSGSATSRTVSDLATELEMSPLLVRSACKLWLSKSILTETAPDTYQVLETLPDVPDPTHPFITTNTTAISNNPAAAATHSSSSAAAAIAAAETAASLAADSASESLLQQKMAVYHQFILSLLTNQGAMPLPRIVMMLGMVVPGGFPFSHEELKEFLARMVRDGEVDVGPGGVYRAVMMQQS